jgi:exodeoxyribonuclease-5
MSAIKALKISSLITADFQNRLTQDQNTCVHLWDLFLANEALYKCFILRGYAGTGKTSLIGSLVKSLKPMGLKSVLMAPTGRAAKVFAQAAQKTATTIHKKIYRQQVGADGSSKLGLMPNLHTDTLFIIDEASMIGDYTRNNAGDISQRNLLEDVFEYVFTGKNCHLMFVGDTGQLPPVGSDFSPALSLAHLQNHYPLVKFWEHQLNEVVRQSQDSGILFNATALRNLEPDAHPKLDCSFPDVIRIQGNELQEALETCYNEFGSDETLVLCRTNKRTNIFNQQIRGRILWMEEELNQGDMMMVVKNNYYWLDEKSEAGFLANGELIQIKRIHRHADLYGCRFAEVTIQLVDYPNHEEVQCLLNLDAISVEGPNLPREKLRELFFEIEKDFANEHNKRKRYDLIMNTPHFNALQAKHAYAVTCHKAQGGQWDAVFIDIGFLPDGAANHDFHRWLYTALTRAKKRLYLVNFGAELLHAKNS